MSINSLCDAGCLSLSWESVLRAKTSILGSLAQVSTLIASLEALPNCSANISPAESAFLDALIAWAASCTASVPANPV